MHNGIDEYALSVGTLQDREAQARGGDQDPYAVGGAKDLNVVGAYPFVSKRFATLARVVGHGIHSIHQFVSRKLLLGPAKRETAD
jgi:hypothetical protein